MLGVREEIEEFWSKKLRDRTNNRKYRYRKNENDTNSK